MHFRRFNKEGMRRFESFIQAYRRGDDYPPDEILFSESLGSDAGLSGFDPGEVSLESRLEFAVSIDKFLRKCRIEKGDLVAPELWAWLTVALFGRLKLLKGNKSGELAVWYPQSAWRRFYRHVLYGPWRVYRLHTREPGLVEPLLHGKVTTHGEFYEQIAAYQDLVQSPGVLGAARALYWDEASGTLKSGHAIKGAGGKATGSVRRFSAVVQQFALTWDIIDISAEELLGLLPEEFDKWKS